MRSAPPCHHYMRGERSGHTLQTTALVTEVYLAWRGSMPCGGATACTFCHAATCCAGLGRYTPLNPGARPASTRSCSSVALSPVQRRRLLDRYAPAPVREARHARAGGQSGSHGYITTRTGRRSSLPLKTSVAGGIRVTTDDDDGEPDVNRATTGAMPWLPSDGDYATAPRTVSGNLRRGRLLRSRAKVLMSTYAFSNSSLERAWSST